MHVVVDDRGAKYPITVDPIAQQAYLKASNTGASDCFGNPLAVWGDTVVVSAVGEDSNGVGVNPLSEANNSSADSGAAYMFVRTGGVWSQQAYLKASNTDSGMLWTSRVTFASADGRCNFGERRAIDSPLFHSLDEAS